MTGFPVVVREGAPADLVAPEQPSGRLACFCAPTEAAVVLGSTQDLASVDTEELRGRGIDVVRRRSGGGAVYVAPGAQMWLDLYVPADDEHFLRDVGAAAGFVGELWVRALQSVLGAEAPVALHRGPLVSSRWSRTWCYSGVGPGEVLLGGAKLVGLSQRRNRDGAWFFTMVQVVNDPRRDASLLALDQRQRAELVDELSRQVAALPADAAAVESALRRELAVI